MTGLDRVRLLLDDASVAYRVREHQVAYTTQEIARVEHVRGRRMAKVVMVLADQELVMLVVPAPARVDLARVAAALGTSDVRLAHEEEFAASFPDCDPGAMPPFGAPYGIPVWVDRALTQDETIVFQAGTHRHTMEVAYADYARLTRPSVASLCEAPSS